MTPMFGDAHEVALRDPQSVLRKQLGDDLTVVSFASSSFVKVGDNYGSTILKVRLIIKRNNDAEEEELDLVAKMLPTTDYQRELFESSFTFKKEIFVYENLIPTYKRLYQGDLDVLPKFYGARLSLNPDADEVDNDAVIFMENLKSRKYYMGDRHKGLDLAHLKIAVSAMAKFHAVGLSIKYKKPSYLSTTKQYTKTVNIVDEAMIPFVESSLNAIKNDIEVGCYYEQVKATGNLKNLKDTYYLTLDADDPWACIVHSDFWLNNVLFHRDEAGNLDDAKIVDFQMYTISSPLTDLLFFLCTSMEMPLKYFDELLELYRIVAHDVLKKLNCDVSLFSRKKFEERLKIDAAGDLYHTLAMIKVIELREGEDILQSPNEHCKRRLRRIVNIYADKKWI